MNVLVTGCNGFIGSHLTMQLLKKKYNVVGLDVKEDLSLLDMYMKQARKHGVKWKFVQANVCDTTIFTYERFDAVCHLAALAGVRKSIETPVDYISTNIAGQTHLLHQCQKNGNIPFLYASSSSVYGNSESYPYSESAELSVDAITSPYALTKKTCEEIAKVFFNLYKQPSIGLRIFTAYGPRCRVDMAPRLFLQAIQSDQTIQRYGDGNSTFRDYTFVSDIVSGFMLSLQSILANPAQCEIYNVARGVPVTLNTFIKECELALGKEANIVEQELHCADVIGTHADISKISQKLNYRSKIGLKKGLHMTVEWMLRDVVLTCYFTSKLDPQNKIRQPRDCYEYIKPWHSTMTRNSLNGIIFHDGLSESFIREHTTETVSFHYVNLSRYRRESLNDIRFYVYYDYLRSTEGSNVKRVFMTDVSDVYVCKSPFEIDDCKLYVGKEQGKIQENTWMVKKIKRHIRVLNFNTQIATKPLVNAGVVGGSRSLVLEFLKDMIQTFEKLNDLHDNANMCVFNFVVWNYFSDRLVFGAPVTSEFGEHQNARTDVFFIHK